MRWIKWGLAGLALSVAVGVVAFSAIGSDAGIALAQVPGGPQGAGRFDELLAQKLGVTVEKLREARTQAHTQLIDEAVASGKLTPEQAAKLKERGNGQLFKPGMGGMELKRGFAALRNIFGAAAEAIGITTEELSAGLREGKSIAEIADENDVERDDLEAGILKAIKAEIARAQSEGTLTAEQAARLSEGLEAHIDKVLDAKGDLKRSGAMPGTMPRMR